VLDSEQVCLDSLPLDTLQSLVLLVGFSVDGDIHLHLHLGQEQLEDVVAKFVSLFFHLRCQLRCYLLYNLFTFSLL